MRIRTFLVPLAVTLTFACEGTITTSDTMLGLEPGEEAEAAATPDQPSGQGPATPTGTVDDSLPANPGTVPGDPGSETAPDMGMPTPDMSDPVADLPQFSFFVTSLTAMQDLSGSEQGFGGDLGGLEGADGICQTIAAGVGFGAKTWRAFLSVTDGGDGTPVNAIDRIGQGPWYDRNGRMVASGIDGLMSPRPDGDSQAVEDFTDENGMPNSLLGDSHDTVTGSDTNGRLANNDPASTCNDWTSSTLTPGRVVMAGHCWPRSANSGREWASDHAVPGCTPGVNLVQDGAGSGDCIGCSGGYGAIYCFALEP